MKRAASLLALVTLSLLAQGCFVSRTYVNSPLDPARLAALRPGESTAAQVVTELGAPVEVVQLGRRSAYRYEHEQTKMAAALLFIVGLMNRDTQADRTWLFFDENDVLSHVGTTIQADEARYAMPWSDYDE